MYHLQSLNKNLRVLWLLFFHIQHFFQIIHLDGLSVSVSDLMISCLCNSLSALSSLQYPAWTKETRCSQNTISAYNIKDFWREKNHNLLKASGSLCGFLPEMDSGESAPCWFWYDVSVSLPSSSLLVANSDSSCPIGRWFTSGPWIALLGWRNTKKLITTTNKVTYVRCTEVLQRGSNICKVPEKHFSAVAGDSLNTKRRSAMKWNSTNNLSIKKEKCDCDIGWSL